MAHEVHIEESEQGVRGVCSCGWMTPNIRPDIVREPVRQALDLAWRLHVEGAPGLKTA